MILDHHHDSARQENLAFLLDCLAQLQGQRVALADAGLSMRALGVSSLGAIALQYKLQQRYGTCLPLELLLSDMSLLDVAKRLPGADPVQEILL